MMYCGRLGEVFAAGGGESSLSGDFALFMCFLSQDLIGVCFASSSSSMMTSLSGSSDLLMSSLLCISVSGCSDCCLDLLHLTACILMLVSDMNLSEQWSHWRLVSRVSSWSLRSRKISR